MTSTTQREDTTVADGRLEAGAQPLGARMLPLRGVMAILDRNEGDVLRMVEDGRLAWVWDVALDPRRARKKALRVLPHCLEDFRAGRECALGWADVRRILAASGEGTVPSVEVERVLNVCQTHVARLLSRKELLLSTKGRRGRGGAALIWRYSFCDFLKRRRYPVPDA